MSNKLKLIRTQIKTDALAYSGNYAWAGKVDIDRTAPLSEDETLHANILLGNFNLQNEFFGGALNEWNRYADIDINIEKGGGASLTGDEILDAEEDFEAIVKANLQWSAHAGYTYWLGTEILKDQEERKIYMAILHLRIAYSTTAWTAE